MASKFNEIIVNKITDSIDDSRTLNLNFSGITGATMHFGNTNATNIYFPDKSGTVIYDNDNWFIKPQVVTVKQNSGGTGEYTSIKSAVDSITDSSVSKPYVVNVLSGVYNENGPINIPQYTQILGYNRGAVYVSPSGTTFTLFNMGATCSSIRELTINNVSNPYYGIYISDSGPRGNIKSVVFNNTANPIYVTTTTTSTNLLIEDISIIGSLPLNNLITVGTTYPYPITTQINNILIYPTSSYNNAFVFFGSTGGLLNVRNTTINDTTSTATGVRLSDGVNAIFDAVTLRGLYRGVYTADRISDMNLIFSDILFQNNTIDLDIDNPNTTGYFNGPITLTKTFINKNSQFSITERDTKKISVREKGGDFPCICDATEYLNKQINVITTSGSTGISSPIGAFNILYDGCEIKGITTSGIASGSTLTYVNYNNMYLSSPATNSNGTTATIFVSSSNLSYQIEIAPGNYYPPRDITIPRYTSLFSNSTESNNIIYPQGATGTIFTVSDKSSILNLNIIGSGATGQIGLCADGQEFYVDNCKFKNILNTIVVKATNSPCCGEIYRSFFGGTGSVHLSSAKYISIDGKTITSSQDIDVHIKDCEFSIVDPDVTVIETKGPYANKIVLSENYFDNMNSSSNCIGVNISDATNVNIQSCIFVNNSTSIYVPNVGTGPNIVLNATSFKDSLNYDINILNPNTTGLISTTGVRSKVFIDPASTISVEYIDPVINGKTIVGDIYFGKTNTLSTEITDLFYNTSAMGVHGEYGKGNIYVVSGLVVGVTAGDGYLTAGTYPNTYLKRLEWAGTTLTLQANKSLYLYFNENGVLQSSESSPSNISTIILGRVVTNSADIQFIDKTPINTNFGVNKLIDYTREVYGPQYVSGSIVSVNTQRQLAVGSGKYYYSHLPFTPSGITFGSTFTTYYHNSGGTFSHTQGVTMIDNLFYDTGTGLTGISVGYYTKHSLYTVGDGLNEKYFILYGQSQYDTIENARNGSLALPPPYFKEGVVNIASIIVQEGTTGTTGHTFSEVSSQRPFPVSSVSAISSSANHSDLLGLSNDDHLQYLLVNGTRAMSGNLNMGTNQITNVGQVDGVTISNHASRHLPNGADPIFTEAPITALSAGSTGTTGTANSLARSDHTHPINTGVPVTQTADQTNTTGSSNDLARADHIHKIETGVPVSIGATNAQGSLFNFARSDHVHQGIHSIFTAGATVYGDVRILNGTGITLSNSSNDITITSVYDNIPNLNVTGGSTLNSLYVNSGSTYNGLATYSAGISATTVNTTGITTNSLYVNSGSTYNGLATYSAGISATNINTTGVTTNTLYVSSGSTYNGLATYGAGISATNINTTGVTTNTLYVSSGSTYNGLATFTTIPSGVHEYYILQDVKTTGTNGGNPSPAATWNPRNINLISSQYFFGSTPNVSLAASGIGVSNSTFTLNPGTWLLDVSSTFYRTGNCMIRLFNITTSTITETGLSVYATNNATTPENVISQLNHIWTISASTNYRIEFYVTAVPGGGAATQGLGRPAGIPATNEKYSTIRLQKLA